MKASWIVGLAILAALCLRAPVARAAEIPSCTQEQLLGFSPNPQDVKSHARFPPPFISYPFATKMPDWGFKLMLRIDESGRVVCASAIDEFTRKPLPLNDQRRAFIATLKDWRYEPFVRDGNAVPSILSLQINERESPAQHIPLPEVPLDKVHISLERTGCFGACSMYKVDVYGDGRVVYRGDGYVDVLGRHQYQVSKASVARLVESLRAKDLWSLRPEYHGGITDNPTYTLTFSLNGQKHQIEDYVGAMAGMPATVSEFEVEVDVAARSAMWIRLSQEALDILDKERFDFTSAKGAELLSRAVTDADARDDPAVLRLIELGAPIEGAQRTDHFWRPAGSVIDEALRNQRATLIDPLIAKGALNTGGKLDQRKIDAAFRAAIVGGSFALVQKIWNIGAEQPHPSLTFIDKPDDAKHASKEVPVTLELSHYRGDTRPWEGLQIAKWLIARGCDMKASKANGETLLHIATQADDIEFVRYLLQQGFDASTPGNYGTPALGSAEDEDIALLLLQAGTDMSKLNDGYSFRDFAEQNHWARVIAWLDSHGQTDPDAETNKGKK